MVQRSTRRILTLVARAWRYKIYGPFGLLAYQNIFYATKAAVDGHVGGRHKRRCIA